MRARHEYGPNGGCIGQFLSIEIMSSKLIDDPEVETIVDEFVKFNGLNSLSIAYENVMLNIPLTGKNLGSYH